jgi:hypothetical protein
MIGDHHLHPILEKENLIENNPNPDKQDENWDKVTYTHKNTKEMVVFHALIGTETYHAILERENRRDMERSKITSMEETPETREILDKFNEIAEKHGFRKEKIKNQLDRWSFHEDFEELLWNPERVCSECGKILKSERGCKSHKSRSHGDDEK